MDPEDPHKKWLPEAGGEGVPELVQVQLVREGLQALYLLLHTHILVIYSFCTIYLLPVFRVDPDPDPECEIELEKSTFSTNFFMIFTYY